MKKILLFSLILFATSCKKDEPQPLFVGDYLLIDYTCYDAKFTDYKGITGTCKIIGNELFVYNYLSSKSFFSNSYLIETKQTGNNISFYCAGNKIGNFSSDDKTLLITLDLVYLPNNNYYVSFWGLYSKK